ncbi:MAG: phosphate ABC transporter substrate-binding/OmpA family protein [Hyphomicrobiaceae bacterium]|nr:phosphate ABC transporter substrate-binding/OmpA family protein [Hyphomicrobiaceae bacterium]
MRTIVRSLRHTVKYLLVGLFGLALPLPAAAADDITLRLVGGGFEVTGALMSFDGTRYVITSPIFGAMTLQTDRFECVGGPCPKGPVGLSGPGGAGSVGAASGSITIAGSSTIGASLMPALVEAYARSLGLEPSRVIGSDPQVITIEFGDKSGRKVAETRIDRRNSAYGFEALATGTPAIGMSSRRVRPEEAARLAAAGLGDFRQPTHEHVVGLDGLVFAVAYDNPAVSLSIDAIAGIFAGTITDWAQVGLPAGRITVYAPEDANGTLQNFDELVMKPRRLTLTPAARRAESLSRVSDLVAADPGGIGVLSMAYAGNAKPLNIEAACGLVSRPTRFAMKAEEYPLTRRLYLYTPGTPKAPLARDLLTFALSPSAQSVVAAADFVDQEPESLAFQAQGSRIAYALNARSEDFDIDAMRALIGDISKAERLSTTLRFEFGSAVLDTKALADVGRLATLLATPAYAGRSVKLIGFADAVGSYATNLDLSRRRAVAVAEALKAKGYDGAVVKAYSELAPVACNDTSEERNFNRRVEVWIE